MRLKYLGTYRRVVGPLFVWAGKNAVVDVTDADLAALLLTQPDESFEIAADEPLLQVVDADSAGRLVLAGIAGVEALATAGAQDVATALGISLTQARACIRRAREIGREPGVGSTGENEMTAAEE